MVEIQEDMGACSASTGPSSDDGAASVSALRASVPSAMAEQVLSMGRVEWGATAEFNDAGHLEHLAKTLRLTRERFNYADVPVAMHGLYLEGTEKVLCHTGTSPNSGPNAQAMAGAWNWLHDQCASAMRAGTAETAQQAQGQGPASAVRKAETPNPGRNPDTPEDLNDEGCDRG